MHNILLYLKVEAMTMVRKFWNEFLKIGEFTVIRGKNTLGYSVKKHAQSHTINQQYHYKDFFFL